MRALKRKRSTSPGMIWPLTTTGSGSANRRCPAVLSFGSFSMVFRQLRRRERQSGFDNPDGVSSRSSRSPSGASGRQLDLERDRFGDLRVELPFGVGDASC